uniref:ATP synthase F0 subunit 8 n=1 Tax=Apopellia endiviifolia TaxID=304445 RepID=UPI00257CB84C|nr:ATP synthase F0 subunit 8 [Apopellia endiviifolia]WIA66182.1 ATP synthase F0 subunit 8 [Apopellia endiviifolia]WIA66223.1 ATP synthase F0 subunit 8 [Apopellia endiviifolia]WIA66428.1 ATP synthase F0 subunit 8 [Apopellia endiviifolia]WIA66469.1 ATP synthase F0 subunit 8 [Apopellia endiviifolia]WIA66510.1 ATP synthase F0 subunit 8 [Apopellia endiviifolia]
MPQLDQFTYLTQFVWLCVFYMTFYVLLYNDGLPKISRIIKLRKRLVSQKVGAEQSNGVEQDVVFKECFQASANYLYSSVSGASKWCKGMVQLANANKLQRMNKDYVCSLGEISVSQVIKKNAFSTLSPSYQTSLASQTALNKIYVLRGQKRTLAKNEIEM